MADSQEKRWQDHPVIIAVISGAAALVFAYNVLFPTLTASLQNEVTSLRSQVQEIRELKNRIAAMEAAAKVEKQRLAETQMTNLFALGSPYPIGLGKVKIGDTIDSILTAYPEAPIDRHSTYWSVPQDHALFSQIAFFFERDSKPPRVRSLLIHLRAISGDLLQAKLIESLGQPSSPGPKKDCFIWKVQDKLFVKRENERSFLIDSMQPNCNLD